MMHRDTNPAVVYRESLSTGSYWGIHHSLTTIARLLAGEGTDPWTFPWSELRYRDTAAIRAQLIREYAPSTVNRMLSALRSVLKNAWRLGQMDAETYRRAADIENIRAKHLPSGRAVTKDEVKKLFAVCTKDRSPAGRRDAAILAVLYGCGLRRAEACGLDLSDFDYDDCALTVRQGKGRRQRVVFLTRQVCGHLRKWIAARGNEAGALFCPISSTGEVRVSRLGGESLAYIFKKRTKQAGVKGITPHSLRRSFVTGLLEAGVDVFTVQRLAGHADAVTTARYDRRGDGEKRRAVGSLALPA